MVTGFELSEQSSIYKCLTGIQNCLPEPNSSQRQFPRLTCAAMAARKNRACAKSRRPSEISGHRVGEGDSGKQFGLVSSVKSTVAVTWPHSLSNRMLSWRVTALVEVAYQNAKHQVWTFPNGSTTQDGIKHRSCSQTDGIRPAPPNTSSMILTKSMALLT